MVICAFFVDAYVIHIKNVPFRMNGMFLHGLFKGGATFKVRHYFQDVKELYRFLFSLLFSPGLWRLLSSHDCKVTIK